MTRVANTPTHVASPVSPPTGPAVQASPTPPGPAAVTAKAGHQTLAEWWYSLGEVPLQRILMNPWPGTATEQDLLVLAERDGRFCELIDGTLVEKPVGRFESVVASNLIIAVGAFVRPRKLGFVSGGDGPNRMSGGNVRMPDVTFVSVDDLPNREFPKTPIPSLKPTLVAEVLSASNTPREIKQKLKECFESGTRLAWVIDPVSETVAVYDKNAEGPTRVLVNTDVLDGGTVLPGFQINVSDLFVTSL